MCVQTTKCYSQKYVDNSYGHGIMSQCAITPLCSLSCPTHKMRYLWERVCCAKDLSTKVTNCKFISQSITCGREQQNEVTDTSVSGCLYVIPLSSAGCLDLDIQEECRFERRVV